MKQTCSTLTLAVEVDVGVIVVLVAVHRGGGMSCLLSPILRLIIFRLTSGEYLGGPTHQKVGLIAIPVYNVAYIAYHMHQRDLQVNVLECGALQALGCRGKWRAALTGAYDAWKPDFDKGLEDNGPIANLNVAWLWRLWCLIFYTSNTMNSRVESRHP
jgi:hypothetical protein